MTTADTALAAPARAPDAPFDSIGPRYDRAYPDRKGQLDAGAWLLERLPAGSRVLDLGCGSGLPTARQLSAGGLRVTGVDIAGGMLSLARERVPSAGFHRLDLRQVGTAEALAAGAPPELGPDARHGFDAVAAFFSLMLLPRAEIPAVLRRIRGLLAPGGLLVLGMVEADVDDYSLPFLGREIRVSGYLREELAALLTAHGFRVEHQAVYPYAPASTEVPPEEQLYYHCRT
ncbi:class I SAM-dependent methyltransferase [Phaeacidiphilus oryzae]|uniref:class I SAM-dependent methyltransferase n=1 Tax=Phaeacidiphilus oryzae TaxID=348818 RepID=UPI00056A24C5|nr:class I SAM-dependent methyltransferase [Phaeacidiphilus oryzae]